MPFPPDTRSPEQVLHLMNQYGAMPIALAIELAEALADCLSTDPPHFRSDATRALSTLSTAAHQQHPVDVAKVLDAFATRWARSG
jgi:uncharacterized protein (DUF2267 family)